MYFYVNIEVQYIVQKVDDIIGQVKFAHRQRIKIEEPLLITIIERSCTAIDGGFLHLQLLLDVFVRMDLMHSTQVKKELTDLYSGEYKHDANELVKIREFKNEYQKEKALWWYEKKFKR